MEFALRAVNEEEVTVMALSAGEGSASDVRSEAMAAAPDLERTSAEYSCALVLGHVTGGNARLAGSLATEG